MLKRLAVNTLITGTSFLVTGLVPLLLVPLLVHRYGVSNYGLLVLARLLLPTGVLAVFDLGKSEIASYSISKGRHDNDWERVSRYLGGLLLIALFIGVPAAVFLYILTPAFITLFNVPTGSQEGFRQIISVTSLSFPLLLISLIGDGILKGFEDFKRLRSLEVLSTLLYAVATALAIYLELPYQWMGFIYVAYGVLKGGMVCLLAWTMLATRGCSLRFPHAAERADLKLRCIPLGLNRTIGVGQGHAAPVLIGALLGSAAVGLFDIVVRIPRFLKIVTGVLNSAVLPIVMRLDAAGDKNGVRRLFDMGLLGVLCVVAPIVAWGMGFSEAILRLWVSGQYSGLWPWQALMFAWPLVNAITSFTCGALLGRPHFVSLLNWVVLGQIVLQISVSLAVLPFFKEQSFVAGQIIAVCTSLPVQLWLVFRECGLRVVDFRRHAACILIFSVAVAGSLYLNAAHLIHTPSQLVLSMIIWILLSMLLVFALIMRRDERLMLRTSIEKRFSLARGE